MAEYNGLVGTFDSSHNDILASLSFPYRIHSYAGPDTAGTADAVLFEMGHLVCYDDVTGKLRKYVNADTEPIEGIVAEEYDGTALNTAGSDASFVSVYVFGAFTKAQGGTALANQKVFADTNVAPGTTNKVLMSVATISAARDRGLYIA